MNSSNIIEISKSSLVGLKAELFKKQDEVKRIKELQKNFIKPLSKPKKKSVSEKSNDGIEKRRLRDAESQEEDYDALRKSREVLEAKSRLYDKLKENHILDDESKSKYLIDFDLKRDIDKKVEQQKSENKEADQQTEEEEEKDDDFSDHNSDPENDWVDFVDTLGRSRRCLRKDLPVMKSKDDKLAASLKPPSPPPAPEPSPELLSWDMQREMLRKKWEEEEILLLSKKDIHYQDVRFDEARPHGVGYFEFSKDESERIRQQQELKNLRKETLEQQEAALGLRLRRQQQMEARLAAARRRKRERLGLPPEPEEPEEVNNTNEAAVEEEKKEEQITELEESIKKIAPVRPWDVGKEAMESVMTQEEWVEKKRQERPEEFAPPARFFETTNTSGQSKRKQNPSFFTPKKAKTNIFQSENEGRNSSLDFKQKNQYTKDNNSSENTGTEHSYVPLFNEWHQNPDHKIPTPKQIFENKESEYSKYNQSKDFESEGKEINQDNNDEEEECYGPSLSEWQQNAVCKPPIPGHIKGNKRGSSESEYSKLNPTQDFGSRVKITNIELIDSSDNNYVKEESYGPSLNEWNQYPNLECSTSESIVRSNKMKHQSPQEGNKEEVNKSTSCNNWRPTADQIDSLLLNSRFECSKTSLNESFQQSTNTSISRKSNVCPLLSSNSSEKSESNSSIPVEHDSSENNDNLKTKFTNKSEKKAIEPRTQSCKPRIAQKRQIKFRNTPITNYIHSDMPSTEDSDGNESPKSPIINELEDQIVSKRKGVNIPPPSSMSYYVDDGHKKPTAPSNLRLAESISVGFNYLKTRSEDKQKKRLKGMLDIL